MRTTAQSAALALGLALQDRTAEAAHELGQLSSNEREAVRRALTALLLACTDKEEDADG